MRVAHVRPFRQGKRLGSKSGPRQLLVKTMPHFASTVRFKAQHKWTCR